LPGYKDTTIPFATAATDTALTQDISLTADTFFSWSSTQEIAGGIIEVWVGSSPAFKLGDESTAQVTTSEGSLSSVQFDANSKSLYVELTPTTLSKTIQLNFSAQPAAGQLRSLKMDVLVAQVGDQQQNFHVFQRVSQVAGTTAQVTLAQLGSKTDLSGVEIPAFGVSANVEAIRMERVQDSFSQLGSATVYRIDAYAVDELTGVLTQQGNSEIKEIFLTFSYPSTEWDPTRHSVNYSEDNGATWTRVSPSDVIALDVVRHTITVRSSHLSLWSLSSTDGLFGQAGGSSNGGGCLLKD
jgi:hypothetical protein